MDPKKTQITSEAKKIALRYPVSVRWDDDEQVYIGAVHSLAGDICRGSDPVAVFKEARKLAVDVVIIALRGTFELPSRPKRISHFKKYNIDFPEICKRLDLSEEQCARLFGVAVSTYRKWETGELKPTGSARVLLRLAESRPDVVRAVLGEFIESRQ